MTATRSRRPAETMVGVTGGVTSVGADRLDAKLLAAARCHGLIVMEQLACPGDAPEGVFDEIVSRGDAVLDELSSIPARTLQGMQAKALALAMDAPDLFEESPSSVPHQGLLASLLADILGLDLADESLGRRLRAGSVSILGGAA